MAFEHNELSGSVFNNKYSTPNDNKPDMTGECKIGGVVYRVAGWWKQTRSGDDFLSIAFTDKEEYQPPAHRTQGKGHDPAPARETPAEEFKRMTGPQGGADYLDDDVPF